MTPDNIKYGHTPTGPEVIAGVTLKDAKRASKWPAYVDVAQSVTGAILGIFLFCHMAFTSSIQVGKDLFWNLIQVSGAPRSSVMNRSGCTSCSWASSRFASSSTLCALCVASRLPTSSSVTSALT